MKVGIDLGGTKIEAVAIDEQNQLLWQQRLATPQQDYQAILQTIKQLLINMGEAFPVTKKLPVGIGTPGSSDHTGAMKNCNTTALNGQLLLQDLQKTLQRPVRIANDANCFALSEAVIGAGKNKPVVFGVIIGTGVGGALIVNQQLITGINGVSGEWGHNPMPLNLLKKPLENRSCYCGKTDCVEAYLSGRGLSLTYQKITGDCLSAQDIALLATSSKPLKNQQAAIQALEMYYQQFAAAISTVVNIIDPDIIVLGGGLSNLSNIAKKVSAHWGDFIIGGSVKTIITQAKGGDSSGVFGAAWLWGNNLEDQ